jgi:DNA (cytosine-5)-methyltransferase 1
MEIVWQCEIDPYCRKVLAKHWPDVHCYEDVRDIDEATPKVDLICGGFPCQPVSTAGRRQVEADPRWLWPEFARVIGLLRPRYVLVENVPGLLTKGMGFVLTDLSSLGYDAEWGCVSAAALGAPHIRNRVFVVAHAQCAGLQGCGKEYELQDSGSEVQTCRSSWWATEPNVGRVADGVPSRVDRLRGLGNAVVPQVAEYVGREIMRAAGYGEA